MKQLTKIVVLALLGLVFGQVALAADQGPKTLEELLQEVKKARTAESRINRQREARFRAARDRQAQLLAQAKAEKKRLEARREALKKMFDDNEKKIAQMELDRDTKAGNLGEMMGIVRQVSGQTAALVANSLVSSQVKGRKEFLADLANSQSLPEIDKLKKLWVIMLTEMAKQGEVVRFPTTVISTSGISETREVVRVGAFNIIDANSGEYLYWDAENQAVKALARQPESKYVDMAKDFVRQTNGVHALAMDPSRGALLELLTQKKSLWEQYQAGGIVGYVITGLFIFGVILTLIRLIGLMSIGHKVRAQMKSSTPGNNPLGRIMKVYLENKDADVENLELKLDEAILKETPKIEWGIGIVKVLAALSPMLGLLGTVTGMIGTFQAITLFGTGDPKMMAGGISTALVTTVLGLISAIPLIFLHSLLAGQSRSIIHILEEQSAGLIAQHAEKES